MFSSLLTALIPLSQWGYFMVAPPIPSGTRNPKSFQLSSPKLVSSLLDLEYASEVCRQGFPQGKHYKMPAHPNVDEVNKLGGFQIAKHRLAFINGQCECLRGLPVCFPPCSHLPASLSLPLQPLAISAA